MNETGPLSAILSCLSETTVKGLHCTILANYYAAEGGGGKKYHPQSDSRHTEDEPECKVE